MNVSSGYYNWHADDEYLNVAEVEISLAMATELIAALGNRRYDYDASTPDTAKSPVEVTQLRLPFAGRRQGDILCEQE
jgi:hypothetical protein